MTSKLKTFRDVPKIEWPPVKGATIFPVKVFQSSQFLVQVFEEPGGIIRLTINDVKRRGSKWADGITWDVLQAIKSAVGYRGKCAVEVYPEDNNVVNVANMRHLFVLPIRPSFAWRKNDNNE